jgi:hypothetical protein
MDYGTLASLDVHPETGPWRRFRQRFSGSSARLRLPHGGGLIPRRPTPISISDSILRHLNASFVRRFPNCDMGACFESWMSKIFLPHSGGARIVIIRFADYLQTTVNWKPGSRSVAPLAARVYNRMRRYPPLICYWGAIATHCRCCRKQGLP